MKSLALRYVLLPYLFVYLQSANAQHPRMGKCPNLPAMEDFKLGKMMGRWFEVERSFYVFEMGKRCVSITFAPTRGRDIQFLHNMVNRWSDEGSSRHGMFTQLYPRSAIFRVHFNKRMSKFMEKLTPGVGTYKVLDTDYDNYTLIWSCSNLNFFHTEKLWVFSRQRALSVASRMKIHELLQRLNINKDRLRLTNQKNCPFGY